MIAQLPDWPAVLSTEAAKAYVGGRVNFDLLIEHHGKTLVPFRRTPRGDSWYRRDTIDAALAEAESMQTLVAPVDEAKRPPRRRRRSA